MKRLFNTYNEAGENIAGPLPYMEALREGRKRLNEHAEENRFTIKEDGNAEAKAYEYQRQLIVYRATWRSAEKNGEEAAKAATIAKAKNYKEAEAAAIKWLMKRQRRRVVFVQAIEDGKTTKEYTIPKAAHRAEAQAESLEND